MEAKLMYKWIIAVCVTILTTSTAMAAEESGDYRLFAQVFSSWTDAFNHKDLAGSCNLFAKNMVANYQGMPPKSYTSICDGFKKIFNESRDYKYNFKLHQVYKSNDLAALRITWYLTVSENGKLISTTTDEGLDVFQQDSAGNWKIINYLSYPKK
jgi:ketosteroid isomerase-like protein